MARWQESDVVEFILGPHGQRPGWQEARIVYNYANPKHRVQVDAALDALLKVRHAVASDDEVPAGEAS